MIYKFVITSIKEFREYLNENMLIPRRSKEERDIKLYQNNYRKINQNETFECDDLVINSGFDFPETYDISKMKLKTINGDVRLRLDHIPKWLENITINGDLLITHCGMSTLKYCPTVVNGNFYCYGNTLTSLKYCPTVVNRNFYCDHNKLTSLEGCPKIINSSFFCDYNCLTSLEGGPTTVGGNFICCDNALKSLQGCPTTVEGDFFCYQNILPKDIQQPTGIKGRFINKTP